MVNEKSNPDRGKQIHIPRNLEEEVDHLYEEIEHLNTAIMWLTAFLTSTILILLWVITEIS